ncbi:aromatic-L-amino-acid decarboxylase-like [Haliotis rufescens]|uniref:aromatic-L-amino-acid decarboxylase-like n=1 Tax=Haliotis rufescens TaxID=6454 RepID=UPI00201EF2AE|nr:aromatic-L-amino-acid decarboxylase-like [Haliotis rufescens]
MNAEEFRRHGREMVDYIADYYENIRDRDVMHRVRPGYLTSMMREEAPEAPETWEDIFKDVEDVVMPGVTHWHSPRFHGYFAAGSSYPSILGDMLGDAIGCIGFSWATSPSCTEIEMVTTDWLGKMLDLPEEFLHQHHGPGGGVIQSTASETVFLCLLAARTKQINRLREQNPNLQNMEVISKLVGYSSDQANSSVHRAGLLGEVKMRKLPSDENYSLRGETLKAAIQEDRAKGLLPFFVCASLGTTGTCAFDNLEEIGPICQEEGIWLHIDAAYAGSAFVCPEFRSYMKGVEYAETFSMNPHKWMLCNFDLSVMWIKDRALLVDAFNVDPIYLKHQDQGKVPDYRHWQIPLGRRFRSLKLWFVIRSYGVSGIRQYIRKHVSLAKEFESMVSQDDRFEIVAEVIMGLVCFRLKGPNRMTELLHDEIVTDGRIYIIPAIARDVYYLRLAVCAQATTSDDIRFTFNVFLECTERVLGKFNEKNGVNYRPMIDIDGPLPKYVTPTTTDVVEDHTSKKM